MDNFFMAMSQPQRSLLAVLFIFVGVLLISFGICAVICTIHNRNKLSSKPHTPEMASNPAVARIDKLHLDKLTVSVHLITVPMLICTVYWALIFLRPEFNDLAGTVLLGSAGLSFVMIFIVRLIRCGDRLRFAILDYENKRSTGKALAPLIHQGYHIFQALEKKLLSIDHLVIGTKGLFAVQVFTQLAKDNGKKAGGATATYDGRALYYNKKTDYETIAQAGHKAEQLSQWASCVLEEPVAARAVIVMPGWTIKRTSSEGLSVVNPGQFKSFFEHIQARPLSESEIVKLTAGIEPRYRIKVRHFI